MTVRQIALRLAEIVAVVLLAPLLLWSRLPLPEFSTFTAPSQMLALIPGFSGILLRRVWYRCTLAACGTNLTVDWLGAIRIRATEIGDRCTLGVGAWIGWARIGNDVMTGNGLTILSGAGQHDFGNPEIPMRDQGGGKRQVMIESNVWIGANVTVMTDVSTGTVIGAGSVVTRTFPPNMIIAGNPARILRARAAEAAS